MNEVILGIDLGTSNSAVGVVDSGFPILLADCSNSRITPSVVWYGEADQKEVGVHAVRRIATQPASVVSSAKRLIGQNKQTAPEFHLPLSDGGNGLKIVTSHKEVSPIQVSADILSHLKNIAETRLEQQVSKAVITVPAYFNDSQRAATKQAAELAGLSVERIISEPTAATLAFGLDKLEEQSKVVVYDLGGGTFDVSLLEMNQGLFQVISTSGDTRLGGDDFDHILAKLIWEAYSEAQFEKQSIELRRRILDEARKCKEMLSKADSYQVTIPFIEEGKNLSIEISREQFEKKISQLIQRTLTHCKQVLLDANIKDPSEELSNVILVGGSSRIPAVRQAVEKLFSIEPNLSQHPDEAIALGAVIQGGIISGAMSNITLLDVTPLSLGIETYGGLMNVIIPRNTTIPSKAGEMFTNAIDSQTSMRIRILQGEREMAKDNWELGLVTVPFEQATKGQARVGVQFSIDENGILTVLTRDTATSADTILEITSSAVDVNNDKVEKMVSESIEHAFEDMAERVFTEAKLKAEELLPAVEQALSQLAEQLDDPSKQSITLAQANVNKHLITKDANQLKAAVQELDKATESLATLLVEKAMEEALMKKLAD